MLSPDQISGVSRAPSFSNEPRGRSDHWTDGQRDRGTDDATAAVEAAAAHRARAGTSVCVALLDESTPFLVSATRPLGPPVRVDQSRADQFIPAAAVTLIEPDRVRLTFG